MKDHLKPFLHSSELKNFLKLPFTIASNIKYVRKKSNNTWMTSREKTIKLFKEIRVDK